MLEITLSLFLVLFVLWAIWRQRRISLLRRLGIPGPEPNFWFGNLKEICAKTPLVCHQEWQKKYGDIYGYYFGMAPVVVIADADALRRIQVSEFHKFMNRPETFSPRRPFKKPGDGFTAHIFALKDKRWKEMRSTLTPSFTASKMKMMVDIITSSIDSLIQNVEGRAQKGDVFDIYTLYQELTMDIIARTAFGIETDCQRNPNDPFLKLSRVMCSRDITSLSQFISFCFPEVSSFMPEIRYLYFTLKNKGTNPMKELLKSVERVINLRRSNPEYRRRDLLQLMLDAKVQVSDEDSLNVQELTVLDDKEEIPTNAEKAKGHHETEQKLTRNMTQGEIIDNAVIFLLTGYETTSTTLAFTTHFLLHYPEVQERIREEVKNLVHLEGKLDYSSVQKLKYLDQVLAESLRMYPPVYLFSNREAGQAVKIGDFELKKGMTIQIPVFNLHRDPRYWEEPNIFNPERFSPENRSNTHPFAFQAFGAGPRNCVGIKLAQMEAKMAIARILLKYKLEICEETDKLDIPLRSSLGIIRPRKGINLRATPLKK